jgi:hypothetical protein
VQRAELILDFFRRKLQGATEDAAAVPSTT